MARAEPTQLNIRSRFARERASQLARRTGMTTTQVVEEALRAYAPASDAPVKGPLVRKGKILVRTGGKPVTYAEAEAALEMARSERD